MPDTPVLQITCRAVMDVRVGNRVQPGVLIEAADIQLLRRLSGRDILVSLVCPGRRPYHAHIQALLRRAVQVPGQKAWFVPTSLTGPLKPPGPPPKAD